MLRTFEKPVFNPGVDSVISIELNMDIINVSFGLMFVKTYVRNDDSPKM